MTGTWTALANSGPSYNLGTMELLTDGSVMIFTSPTSNFRLTPDANGNYVNGTFSSVADMHVARLYDATKVLPDGRVLVLGGKHTDPSYTTTYTNTGEIYNPLTNSWTNISNFPEAEFGNCPTALLADGRVLAGSKIGPQTYIYDPSSNSWSPGPTKLGDDPSWGSTWTKLPDGSILSYNVWDDIPSTQRLDPATMTWIDSGTLPIPVQSPGKAAGPAILLTDGRVFQLGANSNTAIYTPATIPGGTGTWEVGPVLPDGLGARLSSAAIMPNGHVLFATSTDPAVGPVRFFEFNPSDNSLIDVSAAGPILGGTFVSRMLVLPSGQVLTIGPQGGPGGLTGQLYVYTPDSGPNPAWKPSITSIASNGSNDYTLTGTQLNGLSAGATYSYGAEMDSNYPIIQLTSAAGKVYYARTFDWSSTGVATGSTPVSTHFALPAGLPQGTYSLRVIANGIASSPVTFVGGFTGADLSVLTTGPATSIEGNNITYTIKVTNNGPSSASKVVLIDTLGSDLNYVSATAAQGNIKRAGSVVTFTIGTVAVGQTVIVAVTTQAADYGNLTNTAVVSSNTSDSNTANNTQVFTTDVSEAPIVVSGPINVSGKKQTSITVATFTHASGVHVASDYVATINWGDGSTSAGSISKSGATFTVKGSHTYSANGSHTVSTTVVRAGGAAAMSYAASSGSGSGASTSASSSAQSTTSSKGKASATPSSPAHKKTSVVDHVILGLTLDRRDRTLSRALASKNLDALDSVFASH